MWFVVLLAVTALTIAGAAAGFSVYGLATIFAGTAGAVIFMGSALEAGKLVAVSFLYRYWTDLNMWMKGYLFAAIFILMVITSTGIFGYLSMGYQQDTISLTQVEQQISLLKSEKDDLQKRKDQIDKQIAQLPEDYVKARQKLIASFSSETNHINKRLPEITKQIQDLTSTQVQQQAHVGPIIYIAKAFGASVDDAIKWIVMMLIVVFDPLAVVLTLGVNIALAKIQNKKQLQSDLSDVEKLKQQSVELDKLLKEMKSDADKQQADAQESVRELQEYLNILNQKAQLTDEEREEKRRIENLFLKTNSRQDIMRKIRSAQKNS